MVQYGKLLEIESYFADYRVVLAEDELDVDYMLRKLQEQYQGWDMTINLDLRE